MLINGFIDRLREKYPSYQIVVTVTTKTGYHLAIKSLKGRAIVIPSPLDFSFVTSWFVRLVNPKVYIAVETEIWPNLYRQLYRQGVARAVVNGRISDVSFGRYKAIRFLLKRILSQVSVWCMQSNIDAQRIIQLGATPSRVTVTGNIKFDEDHSGFDSLYTNAPINMDEFWWVAGSTHPGEEEIVLGVYAEIIKDNPRWRLCIAPRHIERAGEVIELVLRYGFKPVKFSQAQNKSLEAGMVMVVDAIGHLRSLYAQASLVFVGKSLCVGGGHNVIEPAFYGKAIVIGPSYENFRDIVSCFKENDAIVQVKDANTFAVAIKNLSVDALKRENLGRHAQEVVAANKGATKRSLDHIAELLK